MSDAELDVLASDAEGAFDLSPAVESSTEIHDSGDRGALLKEYDECLKRSPRGGEDEDEANDEPEPWTDQRGHRYFDMPKPIGKQDFVTASRDIYRVVSFVLAPFGFPANLREHFTVSEIKSRCSSLYQDVIEVCSDLVYLHHGLTEGAMAMSVHHWVEKKRDQECSRQVRAINELFETLYDPPVFIEVPDVSEPRIAQITEELLTRLKESIQKRVPWAMDAASDESSPDDDGQASPWKEVVYPSVVYALGFLPPPGKAKKKLSTLQIKAFIQTTAEVVWGIVQREGLSQVEFQALWDAVKNSDQRASLETVRDEAERSLYVVKLSLSQSLQREEHLVDNFAAVRRAAEDGDRAFRSGRYDVALSYYTHALEQLPVFHAEVAPLVLGRIKCHIKAEDWNRARGEAQMLLSIDPFSVGAYAALGDINEKESKSEVAMQDFVTAFILDGSRSPEHASAIDRVARNVGRRVAKDIFNEMVLKHELPTHWLVSSYFDSFEHDVDHAARVPFDIDKKRGVDAAELDPETLVYRAVQHKRKKEYRDAQRDLGIALVRGIKGEPELAMALNLHASFLYVAGDVHAAIDTITKALEVAPTSVNSLVKKGGFLSEIGAMEEAAECFDQAAEVDPNDADVYLHMGQKELLEGNYQEAVQCLRKAMSRSELLPVTHVSYGMALYKSGSVYQAMDVFEDAAKSFLNSTEVHLFYGEVLADQGDYAKAMSHFLRALQLSPQCPLPFLNAGRVYVTTNDPMRAIAHFEQALEIDPRCSSAHLDIAQVLFAQGRTAEAFAHFDAAATCCRFLPEVEEVCSAKEMAKMQERVTEILGVDLRHIMRSK